MWFSSQRPPAVSLHLWATLHCSCKRWLIILVEHPAWWASDTPVMLDSSVITLTKQKNIMFSHHNASFLFVKWVIYLRFSSCSEKMTHSNWLLINLGSQRTATSFHLMQNSFFTIVFRIVLTLLPTIYVLRNLFLFFPAAIGFHLLLWISTPVVLVILCISRVLRDKKNKYSPNIERGQDTGVLYQPSITFAYCRRSTRFIIHSFESHIRETVWSTVIECIKEHLHKNKKAQKCHEMSRKIAFI